jgi:predicted DsbA family dithiol-disulfide isomerase
VAAVTITEFTDPGCPWAYCAEPARLRVRWLYGEHIEWHLRLVGLADSPDQYVSAGFTPERQARAHADFAERYGMPFELTRRPRMSATVPACRAVVAARLRAPEREWRLLRALRVRTFAGSLLDEPETIEAAAADAGIDAADLAAWLADPATEAALAEDMSIARHPSDAALALDHKLAGWSGGRRYTCPSYEVGEPGGGELSAPGFQPAAVYEALIANVAPGVPRRPAPTDVRELLEWCEAPPSSAEVAEVLAIPISEARARLREVATLDAVGADGFWRLPTA